MPPEAIGYNNSAQLLSSKSFVFSPDIILYRKSPNYGNNFGPTFEWAHGPIEHLLHLGSARGFNT